MLLAEAIARRDESRAQILRSRANRLGGSTAVDHLANAFDKLAEQAETAARQSSTALSGMEPIKPDPEGTSRPLADSEGNFAVNAEVAAVAGIGIKASNTGKPAQTIEQAGQAVKPGAQKVSVTSLWLATAMLAPVNPTSGSRPTGRTSLGRSAGRLLPSSAGTRSAMVRKPTLRSKPS